MSSMMSTEAMKTYPADDEANNPRAVIGANNPPTPFETARAAIEDLWVEAANWLDGSAITSQAEADGVAKLLDQARKAEAAAKAALTDEVKPFADAEADIRNRYHPLTGNTKDGKGKAVRIIETCKRITTAWLIKVDDEKRALALKVRKEAEEAAAQAQAAFETSHVDDVLSRERAEGLTAIAKIAERDAGRAEKDKAQAKGGARAIALRTSYVASLAEPKVALRHAAEHWNEDLRAWLVERAQKDVHRGIRTIAGFVVSEVRSAA